MEAIKQFILNWLIPVFTALKEVFSFGSKEEPPKEQPESQRADLYDLYENNKTPLASYRVFQIRVRRFGWDPQKAMTVPDSKGFVQIKDNVLTLREIYNSADSPKVKYPTFYSRVMRSNWDIETALNTPALPR